MNVRRRRPRPDPHVRITPVWNAEMTREQLARVFALLAIHRVESGKAAKPVITPDDDPAETGLKEVPDESR